MENEQWKAKTKMGERHHTCIRYDGSSKQSGGRRASILQRYLWKAPPTKYSGYATDYSDIMLYYIFHIEYNDSALITIEKEPNIIIQMLVSSASHGGD